MFSLENAAVIRLTLFLDILPTLLTSALLLSRQLLFYFPEEAHNIIIQVSGQIRLNELCHSRRKIERSAEARASWSLPGVARRTGPTPGRLEPSALRKGEK